MKDGGYQHVELLQNELHIENVVKDFVEKQNEETFLERFHFHYSGNPISIREIHEEMLKDMGYAIEQLRLISEDL